MAKALLIAEKPSLMRTIQSVYDKHKKEIPYDADFTSQMGHLVTLKLPSEIDEDQKHWRWGNLPFHPEEHGGWQYKIIKDTRGKSAQETRFKEIKEAIHSGKYDFVINAGDPDQEGELLVRLVLAYAGNTLPVKRFWTNDLTESHVLNALQNLKDDDTDPLCVNLYQAALGRQHSDYRFGMNISEAASLKMHARVACGRVKTPILSIVYKREEEIRNFKPSTAYGVKVIYKDGFSGILFDKNNVSESEDADEDQKAGTVWFDNKADAEELVKSLPGTARVVSFEKKRTETYAPKLFKLASLQVEAGKKGYNDAKTLKIIQGLYEKEFLSYPRTDCEYLSSSEDFYGILKAVQKIPEFEPYIRTISRGDIEKVRKTKKWINDKALEEAGHSAIRPTTKAVDLSSLTKEEQEIYSMICRRFVAIFLPPVVQDKTQMITDADGCTFKSTGKTLVDPGYSAIFGTKFTDMVIPEKKAGDTLTITDHEITEKTTKCPKHYTSPGLVEVCESPAKFLDDASLKALGKRLKIGTSATRSSIIRQLIDVDKYLEEKKEKNTTYIVPTAMGEQIIRNLGNCDICKVDLTGIWEEKLEDIRQGRMTLPELEDQMRKHVEDLIEDIKEKPMDTGTAKKYKVIGKCPKCGKDLCEGEKGFFCMGFRDNPKCGIGTFKEFVGSRIATEEFLDLMDGKTITKHLKKNSSEWDQEIKYDFAENKVSFVEPEGTVIGTCPKCGGDVIMNSRTFRCSGSDVSGYSAFLGAELSGEEVMSILQGKVIEKQLSKQGRTWTQPMTYSYDEKKVLFVNMKKTASSHECPFCGKMMEDDGRKLTCSCGFTVWHNFFKHYLTEEEMKKLLTEGKTEKLEGLTGKSGKVFSGYAVLNRDLKRIDLSFED